LGAVTTFGADYFSPERTQEIADPFLPFSMPPR